MRIIFDTNILISVVISKTTRNKRIHVFTDPQITILANRDLFEKVQEVLQRPKIQRYLTPDQIHSFLSFFQERIELLADAEIPERMHGTSLVPLLQGKQESVRDSISMNFHRIAICLNSWGEFYPIRCIRDERYKLVINLFDKDEFYDLQDDPYETENCIDSLEYAPERNRLHDMLLEDMNRIRDPFRSYQWGKRSWRSSFPLPVSNQGTRRDTLQGFFFEAPSIESNGSGFISS